MVTHDVTAMTLHEVARRTDTHEDGDVGIERLAGRTVGYGRAGQRHAVCAAVSPARRRGQAGVSNSPVKSSHMTLFLGSAAVLYSILGTCKLQGVNEWSYLTWALPRLAAATNHTAGKFTPQRFAALGV